MFRMVRYIYLGKTGNLPEIGLANRVVETFALPFYQSGWHITMDNFFTSFPLAESMKPK